MNSYRTMELATTNPRLFKDALLAQSSTDKFHGMIEWGSFGSRNLPSSLSFTFGKNSSRLRRRCEKELICEGKNECVCSKRVCPLHQYHLMEIVATTWALIQSVVLYFKRKPNILPINWKWRLTIFLHQKVGYKSESSGKPCGSTNFVESQ